MKNEVFEYLSERFWVNAGNYAWYMYSTRGIPTGMTKEWIFNKVIKEKDGVMANVIMNLHLIRPKICAPTS